MSTENGRVDYLHQEMQQLRTEMREGFRDVRGDVAEFRAEVRTEVGTNSQRIGKLEQWRASVKGRDGALAAMGGLIGASATFAVQWFRGR